MEPVPSPSGKACAIVLLLCTAVLLPRLWKQSGRDRSVTELALSRQRLQCHRECWYCGWDGSP
jgi:hypothetical protein